jgi:predicted esterase
MAKSHEEFLWGHDGIERLMNQRKQSDYARALSILENEGALYPDLERVLVYDQICIYAALNQPENALRLLKESADRHNFYPNILLDEQDDRFASLVDSSEFKLLKQRHQRGYQTLIDNTPPVFASVEPVAQSNAPLLIAFHGNNSSPEHEINDYRPAVQAGWRVVMPQSAQHWARNRFIWEDGETTTQQVAKDYAYLRKSATFEPSVIVTAGMGKGGEIALWAAASGTIPACGVIIIGHVYTKPMESLLKDKPSLRFYLIYDEQITTMKYFKAFLAEQGMAYECEAYKGSGNEFPRDFEFRLKRALEFITGA